MNKSLDRIDRRILDCLQRDAGLSTAEIADRVGLSTTPCWRRIQNLEKAGILKGRVALLDRAQLDLGVDVFVSLRFSRHGEDWLTKFTEAVDEFPEVVEFYRMSGDVYYLMRVVVADIKAYDAFYKRLIRHTGIADVSSSFAMERIKYTTALPLEKV